MFTADQMTALYLTAQMSAVPFRSQEYMNVMADYREHIRVMDHCEFIVHCEQTRVLLSIRGIATFLTGVWMGE
jgi:hypothetical protein